MGISDQCKAAMIEHGVLMTALPDGTEEPAGMEMMNKDTIRIAIIQANNERKYPPGAVTPEILEGLNQDRRRALQIEASFPENIEDLVTEAMGVWYEGNIEFVSHDENPDVKIFAHESLAESSFASFPINNHPSYKNIGSEETFVALNILNYRSDEALIGGIAHEIGHTLFGIIHPHDIAERKEEWVAGQNIGIDGSTSTFERMRARVNSDLAKQFFGSASQASVFASECSELTEESQKHAEGIMSYGPDSESWYDQGTKELVRTGQIPNISASAKP